MKIFFILFVFFTAMSCGDGKDDCLSSAGDQKSEYLTVACNIPGCRYAVYGCSSGSPVGLGPTVPGEGDQDKSFILDAKTESPTCYKIYCGDVEGYLTPNPVVVELVAGVSQDAYCEYVAKE